MKIKIDTKVINSALSANENDFIHDSEEKVFSAIRNMGERIIQQYDSKRLILVSGPSGSGKTTVAIKLHRILRSMGYGVCYISMDKYFKNFTDEERVLKQKNKIDLESPDRLDAEYLKQDILTLLDGGKINIPYYDFATNTRTLTAKTVSADDGFIIVEGIHALNPEFFSDYDAISDKVYISVRTRVTNSDSDCLHPCKIRLLRRILRDKLYRGRLPKETIKMFPSVQRGENVNILPFKQRADYSINTFIDYEPCIYRHYLFDELEGLVQECADIRDIVSALDEVLPMPSENVPSDALIREFIGGSTLSY